MDHTVWMVVVGEVAAVVHSITIGTLHFSQRLKLNNLVTTSFHLYLVVFMSHHCHYGRSKPDGQLLGTCAWC